MRGQRADRLPAAAPASSGRPVTGRGDRLNGLRDRVLAGALTWLLLLTWVSAVVVAGLYAGGMSAERQWVPAWVVAVSAGAALVTGVPVQRWVRPRVETLLFTHPDDARDLITDVGHQVAAGMATTGVDADAVAAEVAAQVARRLRLPWAGIVPADAPPPAGAPSPERLVRIPLGFGGEPVGALLVLPRPGGRGLSAEDHALLAELAVHVGIALHAARVSDAVRSSRVALVTAREEERRRIRRDLHDGLGPTLASLRLHLAALQHLIPTRPEEALDLVGRLRDEVRGTGAAVRALVYDLRPSTLDELGLVGALRARAAETVAGSPGRAPADIDVSVEPGESVESIVSVEPGESVEAAGEAGSPELPAAVEVALYRIACEALTNVARHSGAARCVLRLAVGVDQVRLAVDDDGRGLPSPLVPGVGLFGMAERAEELGGTFTAGPGPDGRGTRVTATIPLRRTDPDGPVTERPVTEHPVAGGLTTGGTA